MSKQSSPSISSPCISVCALNDDGVCVGCYRNIDEISQWGKLSDPQKREVLQRAYSREKQVNPFLE